MDNSDKTKYAILLSIVLVAVLFIILVITLRS